MINYAECLKLFSEKYPNGVTKNIDYAKMSKCLIPLYYPLSLQLSFYEKLIKLVSTEDAEYTLFGYANIVLWDNIFTEYKYSNNKTEDYLTRLYSDKKDIPVQINYYPDLDLCFIDNEIANSICTTGYITTTNDKKIINVDNLKPIARSLYKAFCTLENSQQEMYLYDINTENLAMHVKKYWNEIYKNNINTEDLKHPGNPTLMEIRKYFSDLINMDNEEILRRSKIYGSEDFMRNKIKH